VTNDEKQRKLVAAIQAVFHPIRRSLRENLFQKSWRLSERFALVEGLAPLIQGMVSPDPPMAAGQAGIAFVKIFLDD